MVHLKPSSSLVHLQKAATLLHINKNEPCPPPPRHICFSSGKTLSCCVLVCKNTCTALFNNEGSLVSICMYAGRGYSVPDVCKHAEPPWDRGRKFIQIVQAYM